MEQKEKHLRDELTALLPQFDDPAVFSSKEYPKLARRRQELENTIRLFDERIDLLRQKDEADDIVQQGADRELTELAEAELEQLEDQLAGNETELHEALTPKDPND